MNASMATSQTAPFPLKWIVHTLGGVGMSAVIVLTYLAPNPDLPFRVPESARIVVFHVPCHWVAVVGFCAAMVYGLRYLKTRDLAFDNKSAAAAEVGLLFVTVGTLTGAVFGGQQWDGSWFYFDLREPKVFSILVLMLIYAALFALRSAFDEPELRARFSAVYVVFGLLATPFLMFVLPRSMSQMHPVDRSAYEPYRACLNASLILYTWLYAWLWSLRVRIGQRTGTTSSVVVEEKLSGATV
jgi:heme exporter protein C